MSYLRIRRGLGTPAAVSLSPDSSPEEGQPRVITVKPINLEAVEVDISGYSPLIQRHDLGFDPDDFDTTRLLNAAGRDCISADQIKRALIAGATRGKSVARHVVKSDLFVRSCEGDDLIALTYSALDAHVVTTRTGGGYTATRLPKYTQWSAAFQLEYRVEKVTADSAVNLLNDVGFGIGIGELTPASGGNFGRFSVTAVRAAIY